MAPPGRACEALGLDARTVQRWQERRDGDDLRRGPKTGPANALTEDEEATIVELATAPEFVGVSPDQLVAKLADMSMFVASEASIYRVLRRRRLLKHRDRSKPRTHRRPRELVATGPNKVWAWDITYLPAGELPRLHVHAASRPPVGSHEKSAGLTLPHVAQHARLVWVSFQRQPSVTSAYHKAASSLFGGTKTILAMMLPLRSIAFHGRGLRW